MHFQTIAKNENFLPGMDYRSTTAAYVTMATDLDNMLKSAMALPK